MTAAAAVRGGGSAVSRVRPLTASHPRAQHGRATQATPELVTVQEAVQLEAAGGQEGRSHRDLRAGVAGATRTDLGTASRPPVLAPVLAHTLLPCKPQLVQLLWQNIPSDLSTREPIENLKKTTKSSPPTKIYKSDLAV